MFRYALAIAAAIGLMSNMAVVEANAAGTTKVVTKTAPAGAVHKKLVVKRNNHRYATLVSKKTQSAPVPEGRGFAPTDLLSRACPSDVRDAQ